MIAKEHEDYEENCHDQETEIQNTLHRLTMKVRGGFMLRVTLLSLLW